MHQNSDSNNNLQNRNILYIANEIVNEIVKVFIITYVILSTFTNLLSQYHIDILSVLFIIFSGYVCLCKLENKNIYYNLFNFGIYLCIMMLMSNTAYTLENSTHLINESNIRVKQIRDELKVNADINILHSNNYNQFCENEYMCNIIKNIIKEHNFINSSITNTYILRYITYGFIMLF